MIGAVVAYLSLVSVPLDVEVRLYNKPLANQQIEVVGFKAGEQKLDLHQKTQANGKVRFDIRTKEDVNLIVRTTYQGLQYYSSMLTSKEIPKTPVILEVFESTDSDPGAKIVDLRFSFKISETVGIDQEIVIENPSSKVFLGKKKTDEFETLRFTLPASSFDLTLGSGFEEQTTKFEGNDIVVTRPLGPGRSRFSMRYALERSGLSQSLKQSFSYPVSQISVSTDYKGLRIGGASFAGEGKKYFDGEMLKTMEAQITPPHRDIELLLKGLPLTWRAFQFLPIVLFLVLLLASYLLNRTKEKPTQQGREKELENLLILQKLRSKKLISEEEYLLRRLRALERLLPYYQ